MYGTHCAARMSTPLEPLGIRELFAVILQRVLIERNSVGDEAPQFIGEGLQERQELESLRDFYKKFTDQVQNMKPIRRRG